MSAKNTYTDTKLICKDGILHHSAYVLSKFGEGFTSALDSGKSDNKYHTKYVITMPEFSVEFIGKILKHMEKNMFEGGQGMIFDYLHDLPENPENPEELITNLFKFISKYGKTWEYYVVKAFEIFISGEYSDDKFTRFLSITDLSDEQICRLLTSIYDCYDPDIYLKIKPEMMEIVMEAEILDDHTIANMLEKEDIKLASLHPLLIERVRKIVHSGPSGFGRSTKIFTNILTKYLEYVEGIAGIIGK